MLVTFTTQASERITYFGEVAQKLLHLMGHSGTVPGAMKAEEVASALAQLQRGIAQEASRQPVHSGAEDEITLAKRAVPLIQLLEVAVVKQSAVLWE